MCVAVKSRRGMTLAELLVTLALVTVLVAMAVSFVMMMSAQTRGSEDNLAFHQDFTMVKSMVESWMVNATPAEIKSLDDGVTGVEKPLKLQNGVFYTNKGVEIRVPNIASVSFTVAANDAGDDFLLFCTVVRVDSHDSYKFCVNPRVGEEVS